MVIDRNQTLEGHTKTSVQMVCLSDYFASKLSELNTRLPNFKYVKTFYGEIQGSTIEYVTIEERIDGDFIKHFNNGGHCEDHESTIIHQQAYCLAHFSFVFSEEKLLLTDIKGCGM